MTPSIATTLATHLFRFRWWLLAVALLSIGAMFALVVIRPSLAPIAFALVGPLAVVPWGLLCVCLWFHPERGNMLPTSRLFGKLPGLVQTGLRWYAALFITLFLIVGLLIVPALAAIGL
jgi:hypothetical protein